MQKLYNLNLQFSTRNFGKIWEKKNFTCPRKKSDYCFV